MPDSSAAVGGRVEGGIESEISIRYDAATLTLRLDQAWRILNLNQELIRSADQKIYLLIVLSTLLVTYVSTNLDKIMHLGTQEKICLILFLIAGAAFFYFALTTVLARSRSVQVATQTTTQTTAQTTTQTTMQTPSLIFFGDIAQRTSADIYAAAFHQADLHTLLDDVCHQIHQVGTIAARKYRAYRHAWMALLLEVSMFLFLEFSIIL